MEILLLQNLSLDIDGASVPRQSVKLMSPFSRDVRRLSNTPTDVLELVFFFSDINRNERKFANFSPEV